MFRTSDPCCEAVGLSTVVKDDKSPGSTGKLIEWPETHAE